MRTQKATFVSKTIEPKLKKTIPQLRAYLKMQAQLRLLTIILRLQLKVVLDFVLVRLPRIKD